MSNNIAWFHDGPILTTLHGISKASVYTIYFQASSQRLTGTNEDPYVLQAEFFIKNYMQESGSPYRFSQAHYSTEASASLLCLSRLPHSRGHHFMLCKSSLTVLHSILPETPECNCRFSVQQAFSQGIRSQVAFLGVLDLASDSIDLPLCLTLVQRKRGIHTLFLPYRVRENNF